MPSLDPCINDLFEPGAMAADSGTVTTPHYSGYLLTAEGNRILIRTTTPPQGVPITLTAFIPYYIAGRLLRLG